MGLPFSILLYDPQNRNLVLPPHQLCSVADWKLDDQGRMVTRIGWDRFGGPFNPREHSYLLSLQRQGLKALYEDGRVAELTQLAGFRN